MLRVIDARLAYYCGMAESVRIMGLKRRLPIWVVAMMLAFASGPAHAYTDAELIDGFNKTVFGSEYSGLLSQSYVRKFPGRVRVFVRSTAGAAPEARVQRFLLSLNRLIGGIRVQLVSREHDANFVVHVVRRAAYADTVRNVVFKQSNARVRGRCMVRSVFTRSGIQRSDAVIVADEGNALFKRCMTEEILQGLGPLNDDRSLKSSMFNDTTRFTTFRRFDRFILNMLYDREVENGVSRRALETILPRVLRRVRARIEG